MNFDWDENKNQANIKKHGVDFRDACYVFADIYALNMPDNEHSENEERWLLLGSAQNGKILLVVHTERIGDIIRIISARCATKHEQKTYYERKPK